MAMLDPKNPPEFAHPLSGRRSCSLAKVAREGKIDRSEMAIRGISAGGAPSVFARSTNGRLRRVSLVIERLGAGRLLRRTADVARGDGNRHSCPTTAVPARVTEGGARDKLHRWARLADQIGHHGRVRDAFRRSPLVASQSRSIADYRGRAAARTGAAGPSDRRVPRRSRSPRDRGAPAGGAGCPRRRRPPGSERGRSYAFHTDRRACFLRARPNLCPWQRSS